MEIESGTPSTPIVDHAALFEIMVESSLDFAIFTVDPDGIVTSWNIGAERVFGFTPEQIVGSSSERLFTPEDQIAGAAARERRQAASSGLAVDERWHQRRDGTRFWSSGTVTPLRGAPGFVKITRDRTEEHMANERRAVSEERFRILAISIPQLVFLTRPDGSRTWPGPQWIEFTGFTSQESLGEGWLDAIHPDDVQLTRDAWANAAASGGYYVEHRVWSAAAKEYRWHQTRARPLDKPEGSDEWVGTMTDIHDLKGLQDRQQVLMAELQHRTRNLLAVVQAIAKQTLRKSPSPQAFSEELEGRLRALGRVQSLLARNDLPDFDLRALVEAELLAHDEEAVAAGRVTIDGPDAPLPAASAQALALGLHELATNAVKHGALAQPDGRLSVKWAHRSGARGPVVALEWRETGVAMNPPSPRRRGYGSELIEKALPYQLKAETRLEFTPDGVLCTIETPVRGEGSWMSNFGAIRDEGGEFEGRRILFVEDEYLIAADLAATLEEIGAVVVGPAASVADALALMASTPDLDAAVLDINLSGERVFPVADALTARGVPFAFATGYDVAVTPTDHAAVPRFEKPMNKAAMVKLLHGAWRERAS